MTNISMHDTIKWVSEALAAKDVGPAMTHYRVADGEISASDGRITAGHPWPSKRDKFLVSGVEFEKILERMGDDEPKITAGADSVVVKSGRLNGTIRTLPVKDWMYPGVEGAKWRPLPGGFIDVLKSLRPFVNTDPGAQAWSGCIALENDGCYATNNIAVAGAVCRIGKMSALLPSYAVDFVLRRTEEIDKWAHTENFIAFKWKSGAWMRSQLVIGKFTEQAAVMVMSAFKLKPTQAITDDFRAAFADVAGLSDDTIRIYKDRLESNFKRSVVTATAKCEVPKAGGCSIWSAAFLAPVISQATHWQPSKWPEHAPFRGDNVAGFIVGRKGE